MLVTYPHPEQNVAGCRVVVVPLQRVATDSDGRCRDLPGGEVGPPVVTALHYIADGVVGSLAAGRQ